MRKKIVAGNWKMNFTPSQSAEFIATNKVNFESEKAEIILCVPYVTLQTAQDTLKGTSIKVAAQNVHQEEKGAYTGEISVSMLKDMSVPYVIVGHSERRQFFNETDVTVSAKTKLTLDHGLVPIVCVGETHAQRLNNETANVITTQLTAVLSILTAAEVAKLVIAYEPVWAIGTGLVATNEQAEEVCARIRADIGGHFGQDIADQVRILYGGSVTADSAKELFAQPNIDGGLVGGASLQASFAEVVKACE